jgi:hypothetical protein
MEVALAEYNALRAEMLNCRTTQSAFIGVGLTAIGALSVFAVADAKNRHLLLAVPALAFIVSVLHLAETDRLHMPAPRLGIPHE